MKKKKDGNFSRRNKPVQSSSKRLTAFELAFMEAGSFKEKETKVLPTTVKKKILKSPEQSVSKGIPGKKTTTSLRLKPIPSDKNISIELKSPKQSEKDRIKSQRGKEGYEGLEGKTQVHDGNYEDESDVVIGFDFGTSSSKIVIRDAGRKTAYAIPFDIYDNSDTNPYLAPTRIFIEDDGTLDLRIGKNVFSAIKIMLMDDPDKVIFASGDGKFQVTALELAAGYMALLIRYSRTWFLNLTKQIYKNTQIFWQINLGIPSGKYYDPPKARVFRTMVMAAWRISRGSGALNIKVVKMTLQEAERYIDDINKLAEMEADESLWLHSDFINTHPEVIMEVVGYARSPLRNDGLHLLVDIGASTMDAATFIIHSHAGEDLYPLLETRVKRLGTMTLHSRRIQGLKKKFEASLQEMFEIDPLNVLPDQSYYTISPKDTVQETDSNFFQECSKVIGEIVRETKNKRDPFSNAWEKGLSVFICGGGGRFVGYKDAIKKRGESIKRSTADFAGFIIKNIPKPDQLAAPDLSLDDYDRLAVAYGLSFTVDEIGKVIPEKENADIMDEKRTANVDERFVSKDMC
jgi:hypothetical protein